MAYLFGQTWAPTVLLVLFYRIIRTFMKSCEITTQPGEAWSHAQQFGMRRKTKLANEPKPDSGLCSWGKQILVTAGNGRSESQRRPDSSKNHPHSQGQTGDNRGGKAGSSPGKTWKHQSKRGDDLLVILAAQSEADDPRDQKETK
jgi:hypothetical protein